MRPDPWISWKWEWWEQLKDAVKPQSIVFPKICQSCSAALLRGTAYPHTLPALSCPCDLSPPPTTLPRWRFGCLVPQLSLVSPQTELFTVGSRHRSKLLSSTNKPDHSKSLGLCPRAAIKSWKLVKSPKGSSVWCSPTEMVPGRFPLWLYILTVNFVSIVNRDMLLHSSRRLKWRNLPGHDKVPPSLTWLVFSVLCFQRVVNILCSGLWPLAVYLCSRFCDVPIASPPKEKII